MSRLASLKALAGCGTSVFAMLGARRRHLCWPRSSCSPGDPLAFLSLPGLELRLCICSWPLRVCMHCPRGCVCSPRRSLCSPDSPAHFSCFPLSPACPLQFSYLIGGVGRCGGLGRYDPGVFMWVEAASAPTSRTSLSWRSCASSMLGMRCMTPSVSNGGAPWLKSSRTALCVSSSLSASALRSSLPRIPVLVIMNGCRSRVMLFLAPND
jgi:hypothetical protein